MHDHEPRGRLVLFFVGRVLTRPIARPVGCPGSNIRPTLEWIALGGSHRGSAQCNVKPSFWGSRIRQNAGRRPRILANAATNQPPYRDETLHYGADFLLISSTSSDAKNPSQLSSSANGSSSSTTTFARRTLISVSLTCSMITVALANPFERTNRPLASVVRAAELATFRRRPVPYVRYFDHIEVVCLLRWGGRMALA